MTPAITIAPGTCECGRPTMITRPAGPQCVRCYRAEREWLTELDALQAADADAFHAEIEDWLEMVAEDEHFAAEARAEIEAETIMSAVCGWGGPGWTTGGHMIN